MRRHGCGGWGRVMGQAREIAVASMSCVRSAAGWGAGGGGGGRQLRGWDVLPVSCVTRAKLG